MPVLGVHRGGEREVAPDVQTKNSANLFQRAPNESKRSCDSTRQRIVEIRSSLNEEIHFLKRGGQLLRVEVQGEIGGVRSKL